MGYTEIEAVQAPTSTDGTESHLEFEEAPGDIDTLFEEVDLFSTALIQGGCTNGVTL
ncbi:hypothetical protein JNW88_01795 [Micromonospora sp. ATA32]|nr:hypothetical protein [Micromonospora sp. ATA32]